MVHTTLIRMARGGMYDQLGGGFARYSVDAHWLVPHFEKMLYDNAQLASLYLHAWLAFGDPECRRVCEETLDYVLRDMTDPAGGFYSAEDADSEGHEGKFYVWTPDEIRAVLGADADRALRVLGRGSRAELRGQEHPLSWPASPIPTRIAPSRRRLSRRASTRVRPGPRRQGAGGVERPGLPRAGRGGPRARARRLRGGGRPQRRVPAGRDARRRPAHAHVEGRPGAQLKGYLEDYAMVAAALLDVYEATFERRWLDEARELGRRHAAAVLGRRRSRASTTRARDHERADRAAAQSLRQRRALRHLGGDRDAAAPGRVHRRGALRGARADGAAARWPT